MSDSLTGSGLMSIFGPDPDQKPGLRTGLDMEDIKKQVGQRIRDARKAKGLTLLELADKVGILQPTLSRYENGKINPTLEMLDKIARELGFTLDVNFK